MANLLANSVFRCIGLLAMTIVLGASHSISAQVAISEESPFHRFVEDIDPDNPWAETKQFSGLEFRNTLAQRQPLRTGKRRTKVDKFNTVRLGDIVDVEALASDSAGVVVALDSVYGRTHHYVAASAAKSRIPLADTRLLALPPHVSEVNERRLMNSDAWAVEAVALPMEYTSQSVLLPDSGGRLSVAMGFEDVFMDAPNRKANHPDLDDGKRSPPVRFSVYAETDGERTLVMSKTLSPPAHATQYGEWHTEDVSLDILKGVSARFVFRIDADPSASGDKLNPAFALPAWGNPFVYRANLPSTDRRPNLILISLDTLRADHLGAYGYPLDTSPNIDAFAKEAFVFENCFSTSSWTTPAHASVFTGLPQSLHRAGTPGSPRLRPSLTTLSEIARQDGYLTAAFTQGHAMNGKRGFHQGFDQYSNGPPSGNPPFAPKVAEEIFEQGSQWLDLYGGLPFVLFLHTYETHMPYLPPDPYRERFTDRPADHGNPRNVSNSEEDRQHMIGLYDGCIAYTDDVLGNFFSHLEEAGLLENTHIILFSDHGEEFWEHGGTEHSVTLYQEILHVPLIVRVAGVAPPSGRIAQYTSLADVFATSIDLLGLDYTPPRSSINLAPLIRDPQEAERYSRGVIWSEFYRMTKNFFSIAAMREPFKYITQTDFDRRNSPLHQSKNTRKDKTFAQDELHFIRAIDRVRANPANAQAAPPTRRPRPGYSESLYNLRADPGEKNSLASAQPDTLRELREELLQILGAEAIEAKSRYEAAERAEPLTASEIEELRALGYLE